MTVLTIAICIGVLVASVSALLVRSAFSRASSLRYASPEFASTALYFRSLLRSTLKATGLLATLPLALLLGLSAIAAPLPEVSTTARLLLAGASFLVGAGASLAAVFAAETALLRLPSFDGERAAPRPADGRVCAGTALITQAISLLTLPVLLVVASVFLAGTDETTRLRTAADLTTPFAFGSVFGMLALVFQTEWLRSRLVVAPPTINEEAHRALRVTNSLARSSISVATHSLVLVASLRATAHLGVTRPSLIGLPVLFYALAAFSSMIGWLVFRQDATEGPLRAADRSALVASLLSTVGLAGLTHWAFGIGWWWMLSSGFVGLFTALVLHGLDRVPPSNAGSTEVQIARRIERKLFLITLIASSLGASMWFGSMSAYPSGFAASAVVYLLGLTSIQPFLVGVELQTERAGKAHNDQYQFSPVVPSLGAVTLAAVATVTQGTEWATGSMLGVALSAILPVFLGTLLLTRWLRSADTVTAFWVASPTANADSPQVQERLRAAPAHAARHTLPFILSGIGTVTLGLSASAYFAISTPGNSPFYLASVVGAAILGTVAGHLRPARRVDRISFKTEVDEIRKRAKNQPGFDAEAGSAFGPPTGSTLGTPVLVLMMLLAATAVVLSPLFQ